MTPIKVLPLFSHESGADYHRVRLPYLCSGGYIDETGHDKFKTEYLIEFIKRSEIVIWNRSCPIPLETMLTLRTRHGFKIVVDLDDWIELPYFNPHYMDYKRVIGPAIAECLKIADLVTCTTKRLRDKIISAGLSKQVAVFPNCIPFGWNQFSVNTLATKHKTFDFIYAGASSHLEDVRLLEGPINTLVTLPGVSVTMAGYQPPRVNDKGVTERARVPEQISKIFDRVPIYHRIDFLPVDQYMNAYDLSHCSLVPLKVDTFNFYKSNLKLIEAAAKQIPVICSAVKPYTDFDFGPEPPVFWVQKQEDWGRFFKYLAGHSLMAEQVGHAMYEWAVENYSMQRWIPKRFEMYERLLDGPVNP